MFVVRCSLRCRSIFYRCSVFILRIVVSGIWPMLMLIVRQEAIHKDRIYNTELETLGYWLLSYTQSKVIVSSTFVCFWFEFSAIHFQCLDVGAIAMHIKYWLWILRNVHTKTIRVYGIRYTQLVVRWTSFKLKNIE